MTACWMSFIFGVILGILPGAMIVWMVAEMCGIINPWAEYEKTKAKNR